MDQLASEDIFLGECALYADLSKNLGACQVWRGINVGKYHDSCFENDGRLGSIADNVYTASGELHTTEPSHIR